MKTWLSDGFLHHLKATVNEVLYTQLLAQISNSFALSDFSVVSYPLWILSKYSLVIGDKKHTVGSHDGCFQACYIVHVLHLYYFSSNL